MAETYTNYVTQGDVVYPANENGEILYSDSLPEGVTEDSPYVLKRTEYLGKEEDKSTRKKYFTLGKYSHNGRTTNNWKRLRWAGFHRTQLSKRLQKQAYEDILGGDGISKFEEMLANGGNPVNLTMRDLRRKDIQNQFLQMKYDSYNDAHTAMYAFQPALEKVQPGHFERVGNTYRANRRKTFSSTSGLNTTNSSNKRPCINCRKLLKMAQADQINKRKTSFGLRSRSRGPLSWLLWLDAEKLRSYTHVRTTETPGDMVDTYKDTYAVGKPLLYEDYDVRSTLEPATTSTTSTAVKPATNTTLKSLSTSQRSTTGLSGNTRTTARRTITSGSSSSRAVGNGSPKTLTSATTTVPVQSSATTEHRRRAIHPYTGAILSDDLISTGHNGGKLSYFDYFK